MDETNPNFISTFSPYNDNSVGSFHFDGSNEFQIISNVNIPVGASLFLSDNISFDSNNVYENEFP